MLTLSFGQGAELPCALVLGGFDGLHLGHRRLLEEAKKSGFPLALTTMLGGKGKFLFTREERREIFEKAGVDLLLEIELDEHMRSLSAETFARELFARLNVKRVYCGEDFRFGRGALGTPELLQKLAPCPVTALKAVKYCSEESGRVRKFSASSCKELLKRGELALLNSRLVESKEKFLGSAYFIGGRVEHGRQVGRTYGFPTLNLSVPRVKLLPPDGVYAGVVRTPSGNFPSILNIGACPTFGVKEKKLEAHLDGFSGDLYGAEVAVYPMKFLRPIEKFSSEKELKRQLDSDLQHLRMQQKEGYV